jgi:hypothetical protein
LEDVNPVTWLKSTRQEVGRRLPGDAFIAPAAGVMSCAQDSLIVLMALRSGQYHTLDEIGCRVWRAVGDGNRVDQVVNAVLADFDSGTEQAAEQLSEFMLGLIDRGLLSVGRPGPRRQSHRRAGVPRDPTRGTPWVGMCVMRLTIISLSLRLFGLERTWRMAHGINSVKPARLPADRVRQICRTVVLAASLCPWPSRCLDQSLVLLWLLRRAGADAQLRFGVLQFPFYAHAWIEVDGVAVTDHPDTLRLYRPFPLLDIARQ